MLLKRHYKVPDGWQPERNTRDADGRLKDASRREGDILNEPELDYIEVKHTGVHAEQNFSERLVQDGVKRGYITLSRGVLTLHGEPEDLDYKIARTPGFYCCHCGVEIPDAGLRTPEDSSITIGTRHVRQEHGDKESPDPSNPSGYRRINHYEVVLDHGQHARYRISRDDPADETDRLRRR